jgi:hypothetical protein
MKESDLEAPVNRFMRKELRCSSVRRQVPVGLRRIDMVGLREGEIISMELKVRDWRGALRQAWRNRLCSHWSYVALPFRLTQHITVEDFTRYGIGICAVNDSKVTVTSEPGRSPCLQPFLEPVLQRMRS